MCKLSFYLYTLQHRLLVHFYVIGLSFICQLIYAKKLKYYFASIFFNFKLITVFSVIVLFSFVVIFT